MANLNMMSFMGDLINFANDYGTRYNNVQEGIDLLRANLLNKYGRNNLRTINNYIDKAKDAINKYINKKLPAVSATGTQVVPTQGLQPSTSKQPQPQITTNKVDTQKLTTNKQPTPQISAQRTPLLEDIQGRNNTNKNVFDTLFREKKDFGTSLNSKGSKILEGIKSSAKGAGAVVGRNIVPALTIGAEAFNTGKALADPYANWQSRALDLSALGGVVGGTILGSYAKHPVIGAIGGELAGSKARNMSKDIREMNKNLGTNPIPMTPEEQAALDFYMKNGITLDQNVDKIASTQQEQVVVPEQSNPQNFPYRTVSSTPQASSTLSPAPRIQDMNPNPEIVDMTGGQVSQQPLTGQVAVNVGAQGNPVQVTGAAAPEQGMTFVPYQPTIDYGMTEQEKQILQDTQQAANQVTSQDILNTLRQSYADMLQSSTAQDPRYQGELIPAQGYYVDPEKLLAAQQGDVARRIAAQEGGAPYVSMAEPMLEQARIQYEVQMANQAGVPYEEYKAAMLDRQKMQIAIRQKEIEDVLTLQSQQTTDMKERLSLLSDIYKSRLEAQREIDKANAAAYGDIQKQYLTNIGNLNVANITQQGRLAEQQLANMGTANVANINAEAAMDRLQRELNDPSTAAQAISRIYSSFGYLPPQFQSGAVKTLPPAVQELLFGGRLTPEQVNQIFGLNSMQQNNPEQSAFNQFMAKIRGVQANEQ